MGYEDFLAEMADLLAISMTKEQEHREWLRNKMTSIRGSNIREFIDTTYRTTCNHKEYLEILRCRVLFEEGFHWTNLIKPDVEVDTPLPVPGDAPQET
jgi:hypothetical protein